MNQKMIQITEKELESMRDRLEHLRSEQVKLNEEKAELESDIAVVSEFVARFSTNGTGKAEVYSKGKPGRKYGLYKETVAYLRELYPRSATAQEVKANLDSSGMWREGSTNLHSMLANLAKRGKIEKIKDKDGHTTYRLTVASQSLDKVK